jgi:hypothetical protein
LSLIADSREDLNRAISLIWPRGAVRIVGFQEFLGLTASDKNPWVPPALVLYEWDPKYTGITHMRFTNREALSYFVYSWLSEVKDTCEAWRLDTGYQVLTEPYLDPTDCEKQWQTVGEHYKIHSNYAFLIRPWPAYYAK